MIVDSCSNLVTGVAIVARFGTWPDDVERHILIPIAAIRSVNASGVELNITAAEAARCSDLDAKTLATPDSNTRLPMAMFIASAARIGRMNTAKYTSDISSSNSEPP